MSSCNSLLPPLVWFVISLFAWGILARSFLKWRAKVSAWLVKLNSFSEVKFQVLWFPAMVQRYKCQVDWRFIITQRYCCACLSVVDQFKVFPCPLPTAHRDSIGTEKGHVVSQNRSVHWLYFKFYLCAVFIHCHLIVLSELIITLGEIPLTLMIFQCTEMYSLFVWDRRFLDSWLFSWIVIPLHSFMSCDESLMNFL